MKEFFALDRDLKLRLIIVFLDAFSYGSVFSSMAIYYNQNMGASLTGLILIISSIASFLAGLVAGDIADNIGRKRPMVWGILLELIGALIALFANSAILFNPWLTFLGFLLISIGYNTVTTTGNAMIIDLAAIKDRKIVFALDYWAANLSIILGSALGAWLFRDHFFDLLLILVVGVCFSFIIAQFFMTDSIDLESLKEKTKENIFSVYLTVAKDRTYMIFMGANILAMSIIMQFDNFLPIHLADQFQSFYLFGNEIYGQRMLTIYLVVACVLVVFLMTSINRLFVKRTHYQTFIIGTLFMTAGMILAFMTRSFWPIFISAIIYTFGEIAYTPAVQVIGAEMMDPERIGVYNGAGAVRQPLASILASLMVAASPWIKAGGVSLLLILTALATIYLMLKAEKRFERQRQM